MISLSVALVPAETGWSNLFPFLLVYRYTSYLELFRYIAPIHMCMDMVSQVTAFTCPCFGYVLVGILVDVKSRLCTTKTFERGMGRMCRTCKESYFDRQVESTTSRTIIHCFMAVLFLHLALCDGLLHY